VSYGHSRIRKRESKGQFGWINLANRDKVREQVAHLPRKSNNGNGFDMVTLPAEMREKVPTSNFFQQGGYKRNPVAIRNNTVAKLIAETDAMMEEQMTLPGALELARAGE
jgi:hypothetical protein